MKIRTVHHLSATGGTLISHAISSLPGVFLLSELNPLASLSANTFTPIDPLVQFSSRYPQMSDAELKTQFCERLDPVIEEVERQKGFLVIRDHSHSDWLRPRSRGYSALLSALETSHDTVSVVTLRHPVEAYSSMLVRGWHKSVGDFDTYCGRILEFLDHFDGQKIFHYEDFVVRPDDTLREIAQALELPFAQDWQTRFRQVVLTGDSGRGSGEPIQLLPLKPLAPNDLAKIRVSKNFAALAERIGYIRDPVELAQKRRDQIVAMRGNLAEMRWLLDERDAEIAELRRSVEGLQASLEHKNAILWSQQKAMDRVRPSLRWRSTAPLRALRALFRNG